MKNDEDTKSKTKRTRYPGKMLFEGWSSFEAKVWWNALVQDTVANVAIVDHDGCILYCNELMQHNFGLKDLDRAKLTLSDMFPVDVAKERLHWIRKSIDSGHPLTLLGMLKGVYHCTTLRPADSSKKGRVHAILWVCNAVSRENCGLRRPKGRGNDVIYAKCHDMGPLQGLSLSELNVLKLIGNSKSNLQIAKELYRSDKSIERYRHSLGQKLGVSSRIELAHIANTSGLLQVDFAELFVNQPQ